MHNHSYENEFNLHVNGISFSYERMGTETHFEKEAKGNSEWPIGCSVYKNSIYEAIKNIINCFSGIILILTFSSPNLKKNQMVEQRINSEV